MKLAFLPLPFLPGQKNTLLTNTTVSFKRETGHVTRLGEPTSDVVSFRFRGTGYQHHKRYDLVTGTLNVWSNTPIDELEQVVQVGSRVNTKRGFHFVSQVLGRHTPTTPARMDEICGQLASKIDEQLGPTKEPTLVIGLAEAATGLGLGTFEHLVKQYGLENSLYIHSSRHQLAHPKMLAFQEEHSHAPSHILYSLKEAGLQKKLHQVKKVVLVDDEITTGKTLVNISEALKTEFPIANSVIFQRQD